MRPHPTCAAQYTFDLVFLTQLDRDRSEQSSRQDKIQTSPTEPKYYLPAIHYFPTQKPGAPCESRDL
jgi:hypothetical protein